MASRHLSSSTLKNGAQALLHRHQYTSLVTELWIEPETASEQVEAALFLRVWLGDHVRSGHRADEVAFRAKRSLVSREHIQWAKRHNPLVQRMHLPFVSVLKTRSAPPQKTSDFATF